MLSPVEQASLTVNGVIQRQPDHDRRDWRLLLLFLAALGVVLTAGVVPGIFIVDENNHLISLVALSKGHVTVANTAGLTPSQELLFFDPGPQTRTVQRTPVAPTAPALYAPIAWPFRWWGWRGLVGLNTIAFLITIALVFRYTRKYAVERSTAWLAAATFAFCGFSIEYAMGLWPQCLSVALCTGGVILAGDAIETSSLARSSVSGFLLGIATGVRYQNAAVLAVVAGAIFLWSDRRFRCALLFALAACLPIVVSAVINHERLNSWNPISKGPTYLRVPLITDPNSRWFDALVMTWARVADYSYRPHLFNPAFDGWVAYDPVTGAHLIFGFVLKKALLQSAPWAVLGLGGMCAAWASRSGDTKARRIQTRMLSLVVFTMMAVFATGGIRRDDGLSFNQRYLLELVPLLCIVFAWTLDRFKLSMRAVGLGCLFGAGVVLTILIGTPAVPLAETPLWVLRLYALLKVPLMMAAGLLILWSIANLGSRARRPLAFWTGMCLGWAMMLHLASDLVFAQGLRRNHLQRTETLGRLLPDHAALVAYWGMKEPAGPLTLERDLVVVDPKPDGGTDTPVLIRELFEQKRRVFLLTEAMPPEIVRRAIDGFHVLRVDGSDDSLLELKRE